MRNVPRLLAVVPLGLTMLVALGMAAPANARSLDSVNILSPSPADPGTWIWRWLNPTAPMADNEIDSMYADAWSRRLDTRGQGPCCGGPAVPVPDAPVKLPWPGQPAHDGTSQSSGMSGTASSGGNGASPAGILIPRTILNSTSVARIPMERAVLHLTEHCQRIFRPPRHTA